MRQYAAISAALLLTGCTLTPAKEDKTELTVTQPQPQVSVADCIFTASDNLDPARCELSFWLDYWAQVEQMGWPKRESLIEQLNDTPDALLQKVILSQPVNTPYKARLRAQHWFEQLLPALTEANQQRLSAIIQKPSEHMLEFESAITLLSKVNNGQDKTIEAQEQQISELKAQLEALLKIESNLMSQEEETQQ
ncbi:hypothetical protein [Alteromonas lipolytica]|uniref:Two-component system QseEF-associated lipoprotein QseG n=1 Tax=Alteromonas lipolytica TaxID=1856405 RepID=A0A1E8FJW6_9ALTE|nr:hypothetical protein [Alteromonas lipolytica]OFI36046.1 hypothetical protein BFC17_10250 [Alteromonas lipolytica]GGF71390.1 hypothetical protein GCM10011338_24510 [Alteromonas lipolytica]